MEESRPRRVRAVPIAVTPEGFWCCPSPAALHKSIKNPHHHHAGGNNSIHGSKQQQRKIPSVPPSVAGESGRREAPDEQNAAAPEAAAEDKRQEQASDGDAQQHKICRPADRYLGGPGEVVGELAVEAGLDLHTEASPPRHEAGLHGIAARLTSSRAGESSSAAIHRKRPAPGQK